MYEANTQLCKLLKRAESGETIYVGAYGQPRAIIAPLPKNKLRNLGAWVDKDNHKIDYANLESIGVELAEDFQS